ncbi:unnamed protein product, partial [Amoebophrya sp. A25]|eukprot:GSA25T00023957001.1
MNHIYARYASTAADHHLTLYRKIALIFFALPTLNPHSNYDHRPPNIQRLPDVYNLYRNMLW